MNINDAINEFLLASQANGNSEATTRWYKQMLGALNRGLEDVELATITTHDLRTHMVQRREVLAGTSYSSYSTALHAFFGWCSQEYEMPNPMRKIARVKPPPPVPKAISPENFLSLIDSVGDDDGGIRNRAILIFMADTGARLGGVVTLTIDRLYINEGYALVTEKGNKVRRVPFTTYTARLLHLWLSVRKSKSDAVWVSMTTGEPLTAWGVREMIKRLKKKAGITGRVNPHSFRHNFARAYLKAGGDVVTLGRLLGHADINTTAAYYAVFSEEELSDLHEKRSPLKTLFKHDSE